VRERERESTHSSPVRKREREGERKREHTHPLHLSERKREGERERDVEYGYLIDFIAFNNGSFTK
jgi:hypothetical protein